MPRVKRKRKGSMTTKVNPTQKLRERIKVLRKKLKDTTATLKERIKSVELSAHAKAVEDVVHALAKKATAKFKALQAAEDKFEKKYLKKFAKKMPFASSAAPGKLVKAKTKKTAGNAKKTGRGRPRKSKV